MEEISVNSNGKLESIIDKKEKTGIPVGNPIIMFLKQKVINIDLVRMEAPESANAYSSSISGEIRNLKEGYIIHTAAVQYYKLD